MVALQKRIKSNVTMHESLTEIQYGGSPIKVGDEEYSLFRDHEYVLILLTLALSLTNLL